MVAVRPGGVKGAVVARDEGTVVLAASTLPGCAGRRRRRAAPQGPDGREGRRRSCTRATRCGGGTRTSAPTRSGCWRAVCPRSRPPGTGDRELGRIALRDLTPAPGRALDGAAMAISPDGRTVVTTWQRPERGGRRAHPGRDRRRHRGPARPPRRPGRGVRRPRVLPRRAPARGARRAALDRRRAARHPTGRPRPGAGRAHRRRARAGTGGRAHPPGRPTAPSCSPPTTRAVRRSGGSTPPPTPSRCGSAATTAPTPTCRSRPTGAGSTRCAPRSTRRRRPSGSTPGAPTSSPSTCRRRPPRRSSPARSPRSSATAEDGTALRAWLVLPPGASAHVPAPAAAVGARRPAALVELLVVAVDALAHGRARLRRAAARPGALDGVRARLRAPRLGALGRGAVHRPHDAHGRRRRAPRRRRGAHRGDGRLLRRLHGQLDRRPHRPLPRASSRTPASGRSTSSRRRPTPPTTGGAR